MKTKRLLVMTVALLSGTYFQPALARQAKRPFTVQNDIGFRFIGQGYAEGTIQFSPDGIYVAVWSEREDLDLNRPEDLLRFYRTAEVGKFLKDGEWSQAPEPVWMFTLSTDKEGQIIKDWRWLADSSGVAFLQRMTEGNHRLVLADIETKSLKILVPESKSVANFGIADRYHYMYTTAEPAHPEIQDRKRHAENEAPAVVGTGRALWDLTMRDDPQLLHYSLPRTQRYLAVAAGRTFEIKDDQGHPIPGGSFALSPNGKTLVTKMPVGLVPFSWETLYPPPYPASKSKIHAGHDAAQQYVRVDVATGKITPLVNAPTANDGGWWWGDGIGGAQWSSDGQAILLPGTFLKNKDGKPAHPCIAVLDVVAKEATCMEELKARYEKGVEEGYHTVMDAWFVGGDKNHVKVSFIDHYDESYRAAEYVRGPGDRWEGTGVRREEISAERGDLVLQVKQSISEPPLLVASDKKTGASRVLWDPNPQLDAMKLGDASVYKWKDKEGHEWRGGLYKPVNYKPGERYPLVIQNHGFTDQYFAPSGVFTTAFAARELAAQGIMVLQAQGVPEQCHIETEEEIPCMEAGYEAGAKQLVSDGLVDADKIGMIGFSRTCLYTMKSLVTESFHLKAASITDGVMADFWQFVLLSGGRGDASNLFGAKPVGDGLQTWLKNSAAFNLDKTNAALMVVGEGRSSLMSMWMPYSVLHYLHKPVDLIMLNTDEHVLTNPATRYASQQGSVDWFRFWLQGFEDPDPSKAAQYVRWRGLKQLQDENDKKAAIEKNQTAPQ